MLLLRHKVCRRVQTQLRTIMASAQGVGGAGISYPAAERGDVVDEHHGIAVPDPYRWMEEPGVKVDQWVAGQVCRWRGNVPEVQGNAAPVDAERSVGRVHWKAGNGSGCCSRAV